MNRRIILTLSAITLLGLTFLPTDLAVAQQKTLKQQLVGTWSYVSSADTNSEGVKSDRWGPNAKGSLIFESNGRYAFMISRSDIPKFAINNTNEGTASENKAVVTGMVAHFGTWSVDDKTKTITTNVEASSFPNLSGTSQKRVIISLTADELKYANLLTTTGAKSEVVWKRVK
jgi:hypothetical protein